MTHPTPTPSDLAAPRPGQTYDRSFRTPRFRWWMIPLDLLVVAVFMALGQIPATISAITQGRSSIDADGDPLAFLGTNMALVFIGIGALVAARYVHGQKWGDFFSVTGRFRGRWFWQTMLATTAVYAVFWLIKVLMDGTPLSGEQPHLWGFLLVIVLTTPLQAAAEELLFRGLVARDVSALFARPGVAFAAAMIVSSVGFAALHASPDPLPNAVYLTIAAVALLLTRLTGGLEAAIALHVVNNLTHFLMAALRGEMAGSVAPTQGAELAVEVAWQLTCVLVTAAALAWLARKKQPRSTVATSAPSPTPGHAHPTSP